MPFTTPSYGGQAAGASYGPPGTGGGPYAPYAPYAPAGPYGTPGGTAGGVPQPRTAPDAGRQVSVTTAGRRFSCTLVLAAAAVLTGLVGGLYGMGLLPGQGQGKERDLADGHTTASPPAGSRPTGTATEVPPAATPSASGTRTDVPKELIGTWKGTVTTSARLTTEFEITIKAGKVGEVVARDKSIIPVLGTDCSGDWRFASATDRSLVLDTSAGPNPAPGICSNGSANERFTLNANGTLHYKSGDGPAGNPEGDLTRSP